MRCSWPIAVFLWLLVLNGRAFPQETTPAGVWEWHFTAETGETVTSRLTLHRVGGRWHGVLKGRGGKPLPVQDLKYDGAQLEFKLVRERDGKPIVSIHRGRITGDTLKGTIQSHWGDQSRTRDWIAQRLKSVSTQ